MALPKGRTNNPNGRPKGSAHKVSPAVRERIQQFCEDTMDELFQAWRDIEKPEMKVTSWAVIAEFGIAKLSRQELAVDASDEDTTGIKVEIVRSKKPE